MTGLVRAIVAFLDANPEYRFVEGQKTLLLDHLDREIGKREFHSTWIEPLLRDLGQRRGIDYLRKADPPDKAAGASHGDPGAR